MEKVAAARAMDWNIELEKDLRSRKPGRSIQSILKTGRRLEQWKNEPKPTHGICTMFGLVPGEDKLFADAIVLRLVDTFASGDQETRICVVKVFLSVLKRGNGRSSRDCGNGIFSKMSTGNGSELLKRVIGVYDSGDTDSKALALVMFGCCADIAKDVAEVRYIVLSSLVSSHIIEAKASLFAAECLSVRSADFASVFLEMLLLNIMNSPETSQSLRLAGAQTFMKMGCCVILAKKSYKAGKELILRSSEEDFLGTMLISLSKLASKSLALVPEQIDLLASFLKQKTSICLRTTVLRCIRYMLEQRPYQVSISMCSSAYLFSWFDEPEVPSGLRCEALHILFKIFSSLPPHKILLNMHECDKLLLILQNAAGSPFHSERILAFRVLVHISIKFKERTEMVSSAARSVLHPAGAVSLVSDRIKFLLTSVSDDSWSSEVEQELGDLLRLLSSLIEGCPEWGTLVLNKIRFLIDHVVNMRAPNAETSLPTLRVHIFVNVKTNTSTSMLHKFILNVHRFLVACLGRLDGAGAASADVLDELKELISFVCHCSLFDCSVHTMYALLLHPCSTWHVPTLSEKIDVEKHAGRSPCKLVVDENYISTCAENILAASDNWSAYTVGKHAASRGAWFVAELIFQQLTTRVESDICCSWIRALSQFSESEKNIQVLFLKSSSNTGKSIGWDVICSDYIEKVVEAFDGLCLSEKIVGSNLMLNQGFCFQRWFIALRAKIVGIVVELLKLLGDIKQVVESTSAAGAALLQNMNMIFCSIGGISSKLRILAQEYNLFISSLIDMGHKSLNVISAIALGCLLLAFCTAFAYINPSSADWKNFKWCSLKDSGNGIHVSLVQSLVLQLWRIDSETCMKLISLVKADRLHEDCFFSHSACQMSNFVSRSGNIVELCKSAVEGIMGLQAHYENLSFLPVCEQGAKFLFEMIKDWMNIPFHLPKYFFSSRPLMGSMIFAAIAGTCRPYELSISRGSHLSLNLCLQMTNISSHLASRFSNLHCILYCNTSFLIKGPNREPQGQLDYEAWSSDIMLFMHERLQRHVTEQNADAVRCSSDASTACGDSVEVCTAFKMNGGRQGFSSCLLDVSGFPVGCYRIHWLCCGIDTDGRYCTFLPLNYGPFFAVN